MSTPVPVPSSPSPTVPTDLRLLVVDSSGLHLVDFPLDLLDLQLTSDVDWLLSELGAAIQVRSEECAS